MSKLKELQRLQTILDKREAAIIHETEHLWLRDDLTVFYSGPTHSVSLGQAKSLEQAKRFMGRMETPGGLEYCRRLYLS